MASKIKRGRPQIYKTKLTLSQQLLKLKGNDNSKGEGAVSKGELCWNYEIKPSPISRNYALRLSYKEMGKPEIVVIEPNLVELARGNTIPHLYDSTHPVKLCLYYPKTYPKEWTPNYFFADTLIPWSDRWLFYFEEWLFSDEWKGGGVHPK